MLRLCSQRPYGALRARNLSINWRANNTTDTTCSISRYYQFYGPHTMTTGTRKPTNLAYHTSFAVHAIQPNEEGRLGNPLHVINRFPMCISNRTCTRRVRWILSVDYCRPVAGPLLPRHAALKHNVDFGRPQTDTPPRYYLFSISRFLVRYTRTLETCTVKWTFIVLRDANAFSSLQWTKSTGKRRDVHSEFYTVDFRNWALNFEL